MVVSTSFVGSLAMISVMSSSSSNSQPSESFASTMNKVKSKIKSDMQD